MTLHRPAGAARASIVAALFAALWAGFSPSARADEPTDVASPPSPTADADLGPEARLEAEWRKSPSDVVAGLRLQNALAGAKRDAYAAQAFRAAYEADRSNLVLAFLHGRQLGGEKGLALMRDAVSRGLGLPADRRVDLAAACRALAEVEEEAGRYADAARAAERLVGAAPSPADWTYLGWMRERSGDRAGAEAAYAKATESAPGHVPARNALAMLKARSGDLEGAIEMAKETAASAPSSADARIHLGLVLATAGRIDDAKKAYAEALDRAPDDVAALVLLGASYLDMDDRGNAHRALDRALAIAPNDPAVLAGNATLALEEGKPDLASSWLAKAARAAPKDARVHYLSGVCAQRGGKAAAAVTAFRLAARLAPASPEYARALAFALDAKGDVDAAIAAYRTAIGLLPRDRKAAYLWMRIGSLQGKKKAWRTAEDAYRAAVAADPKDPDPHFLLAVVLGDHLKNPAGALAELKAYKDLGGTEPSALRWLDEMQAAPADPK